MTDRIPVSLNWLVKKRARIEGEILHAKKTVPQIERELEQARIQALLAENQVEALKQLLTITSNLINKNEIDLKALDHTFSLHEIVIDPNDIPPVRPKEKLHSLKYGEATRHIFACLRLSKGEAVSTTTIAEFVAEKTGEFIGEQKRYLAFKLVIRKRLKALCSLGKIQRHHKTNANKEGSWSLSIED